MRLVAFLDRSLYAQSVIDHAIWLARASNASVDLVSIVSPQALLANSAPLHPGGPVLLLRDETLATQVDRLKKEAQAQLEAAREQCASHSVSVQTKVLEGPLIQMMMDAAAVATVAVMGKRGENADLARLHLGSNFEAFVRNSKGPVLAVSRSFRPVRRALLPVDLDPAAAHAIEALASGVLPPMPVHLLHVGKATDVMEAEMAEAAARLASSGFPASTEIIDGIARIVVPERVVSDEIDLVAMGAFGASRIKSLIFGSLASELIRACQVPILLCR